MAQGNTIQDEFVIYLQKVMTMFILVKLLSVHWHNESYGHSESYGLIVWDQLHYLLDPLTHNHTIQKLAQKTKHDHRLVLGGMQENTQQNRMQKRDDEKIMKCLFKAISLLPKKSSGDRGEVISDTLTGMSSRLPFVAVFFIFVSTKEFFVGTLL
jgi:hypothetical protein